MAKFRQLRRAGRAGLIGALVAVLGLLSAVGYFVDAALAAPGVPAPIITASPSNPTTSSSATFKYNDTQMGVTFVCSLDGAGFTACPTTGTSYSNLVQGDHSFSVEAVKKGTSSATTYSWSIVPPTPAITASPTNPTTSTTASFRYSDTQGTVGLICSLDGSSFSACASTGITYSGLTDGTHRFAVKAQVGSKPPSRSATYSWRVDTTAPSIRATFPANSGFYNGAGWSTGCSPVGVCGTASDPSGVSSFSVGILQVATNKYWDGSGFSSNSLVLNPANGTTSWAYALALPVDGQYRLYVSATDTLGNTTPPAALKKLTFNIATVAPSAPKITSSPSNPSSDKSPEFRFSDASWPNISFSCQLDSGAPVACTGDTDNDGNAGVQGEIQYSKLAAGAHCFYVTATDRAGNVSTPTSFCWTIGSGLIASVSSGSPQYTQINMTFPAPLVAKVTNGSGNPVSGVRVTFSAPSSGASGTFAACASGNPHPYACVVTTNSSGLATASTFKANSTSGGYSIVATTPEASTPANFSSTNVSTFTIAGDSGSPLYPGVSQSVNLILTNPNPTQITVPAGAIGIAIATNKSGCDGPTNYAMSQSLTIPVTIPGNSTKSLADLSVAPQFWPVITMIDTGSSQDSCQGAALILSYSGTANG